MNIYEALMNIQNELVAPKGQFNSFGKYHYRSCEDILEAVKPLLFKYKVTLIITDEIVAMGEHSPLLYGEEVYDGKTKTTKEETRVTGSQRYYVKATATIINIEGANVSVNALAREEENKKGMDSSQLTGSTSSYARKYALNGLFAIDDTKDSDTTNKHDKDDKDPKKPTEPTPPPVEPTDPPKIDTISTGQQKRLFAISNGNNDLVKEALKMKNLTSTSQIKKTDYNAIVKYIEDVVKANNEKDFQDCDEPTPF